MNSFEAVSVTRLYRIIADQIAGKINSNEFAAGQRLPSERDLAERLQVSRASVREALIALELEGYVDVRVGTGVFVLDRKHGKRDRLPKDRWADDVPRMHIGPFDLLDTRLLLEPEAAALTARMATPQHQATIVAAHADMLTGKSHRAHDHAFHLAIAAACGNAALELAISHVWSLSLNNPVFDRLDTLFVTKRVWWQAEREHEHILQAILDRDATAARQGMHAHLMMIRARLDDDALDEPDTLQRRG